MSHAFSTSAYAHTHALTLTSEHDGMAFLNFAWTRLRVHGAGGEVPAVIFVLEVNAQLEKTRINSIVSSCPGRILVSGLN